MITFKVRNSLVWSKAIWWKTQFQMLVFDFNNIHDDLNGLCGLVVVFVCGGESISNALLHLYILF